MTLNYIEMAHIAAEQVALNHGYVSFLELNESNDEFVKTQAIKAFDEVWLGQGESVGLALT